MNLNRIKQIFRIFMEKQCGYYRSEFTNSPECYYFKNKKIFSKEQDDYIIVCLSFDILTRNVRLFFCIQGVNYLNYELNIEPNILDDEDKFITFLYEIKKKYIDDEEYLIKCCNVNKRITDLEKDFK